MMPMNTLRICLLLLAFAGISGAEDPPQKVFTATADPDGIQRVSITGGEYYFDPNYIIVKVNVPVELSVRKEGGIAPHSIEMHSPEAGMQFEESLDKEPMAIKFTPTKTGPYPFSCTKRFLFFRSHAERGMKGTIEVVE
jgi:plastocyanin domain-containing protein